MSTQPKGSLTWVYTLGVGLLVGYFVRPLITDEEPTPSEPVFEPVTPASCERAVETANGIITSQAQLRLNEAQDAMDVASEAFELGQRNDEEEFFEGLIRSLADDVALARVVAQDLSDYGWASERLLRGNDAKVCLGIEE